jgi:beta-lactam-binding protein with PASTA domain
MRFILGLLIGYSIRGKQRALIATLATIAFIVFILIPGIALSLLAVSVHRERLSRPPQTTVPTVIGLTHYNAELRLRAVHLNLRVLARYDVPLDSGVIVFQTPQPGERVDYQTTVGVTIALRPAKTEPPPSSKR